MTKDSAPRVAVSGETDTSIQKVSAEYAIAFYRMMPVGQRSDISFFNAHLMRQGFKPIGRSTLMRWVGRMKGIPDDELRLDAEARTGRKLPENVPLVRVPRSVQRMAVPILPTIEDVRRLKDELHGIPEELVDALGLRLLVITEGAGIQKVENAMIQVASAIAARAGDIANQLLDTEEESTSRTVNGDVVESKMQRKAQAAKNAVGALTAIAASMKALMEAKAVSFRDFGAGDRFSGEAKKLKAEAKTIRQASAADGAKTISQPSGRHASIDADYEDEAVSSMRDLEQGK